MPLQRPRFFRRFIEAREALPKPDRKAPEENQMALLPEALDDPATAPVNLAIALLGTCVAESFANTCASAQYKIDHFLMSSCVNDDVPNLPWYEYDAAIVHITLRQLLWGLVPDGDDLFHVRSGVDYPGLLAKASERLNLVMGKVNEAANGKLPLFFLAFNEPPSSYQGILLNNRRESLYHFVRSLNDEMANIAGAGKPAYYIEINDIFRYYGDAELSDAYVGHFTHAGILDTQAAPKFYSAIFQRVLNGMSILRQANPIKLIISDLDNTLWKGVLAEHDEIIPHLHYEGWPIGYVEALLEFKRRGGLLAISSKNDYIPTINRFEVIWRNRLRIDDFCSAKINWNPKSENIAEILAETNILPSNTLFIDDNPREIEEVRRAFPEIRFLTGKQDSWRSVILFAPQTQVASISHESMLRTEMINSKQLRDKLAHKMNRSDYLNSLLIQVRFDIIDAVANTKFERAFELLNKTNQFNTTGKRWLISEMEVHFSIGGVILALSSSDKIGDNGLVALAVVKNTDLLQVVMSCRVFGFGLETALICQFITQCGENADLKTVTGKYQNTGKNKACASFFKDNGFKESLEASGVWTLEKMPAWPWWISTGYNLDIPKN